MLDSTYPYKEDNMENTTQTNNETALLQKVEKAYYSLEFWKHSIKLLREQKEKLILKSNSIESLSIEYPSLFSGSLHSILQSISSTITRYNKKIQELLAKQEDDELECIQARIDFRATRLYADTRQEALLSNTMKLVDKNIAKRIKEFPNSFEDNLD